MGQGDFAGFGFLATADECGLRGGMMRVAERPPPGQPAAVEQARQTLDHGGLEDFLGVQGRQQAGQARRQHGFAGTADVFFRYGQQGIGILDYKTRKTKPGEKVGAYDNQAMQLAAYGATYWGEENLPRLLAANVFISTTEPGRIEVVKHPDVLRDWQAFKLVASLWRYQKGYDPRQHQTLNQPAA